MKNDFTLIRLLTGLEKLIHHRVYSLENYFKNEKPTLLAIPPFHTPLWLETDNKLSAMKILSAYLREVTIFKY